MELATRRVFRLGGSTSLALAIAYAIAAPLPFLAPLFAVLLTARPGPPIGIKGLLGLLVVIVITLGTGVLLGPLVSRDALPAILIVAVGVYLANYLTVVRAKVLPGTFLVIGLTMISAAGSVDQRLAAAVIQALMLGIVIAIASHWIAYLVFPEDRSVATPKPPRDGLPSNWIALRATLIILPAYLLALTNPAAYMPVIMKSVQLGQQSSEVSARTAGRELLGSTFLGGCLAVLFWFVLSVLPSLWMFFLWTLLFASVAASRLYRVYPSRYSPGFWQNVIVTMLILVGPAVQDSANGDDVYAAFFQRMSLFVVVTLYAWAAIALLERWRSRAARRCATDTMEPATC